MEQTEEWNVSFCFRETFLGTLRRRSLSCNDEMNLRGAIADRAAWYTFCVLELDCRKQRTWTRFALRTTPDRKVMRVSTGYRQRRGFQVLGAVGPHVVTFSERRGSSKSRRPRTFKKSPDHQCHGCTYLETRKLRQGLPWRIGSNRE